MTDDHHTKVSTASLPPERDQDAADRLGHGDVKLTRDTYRRLPRRAAALKILEPISKLFEQDA
jgi:hypothetical protein